MSTLTLKIALHVKMVSNTNKKCCFSKSIGTAHIW